MLMQSFAAETTADSTAESVTVIALSDYQNSGSSNTKDTVNYTFAAISSRGISPYGILFCGDYTQYGQNYYDVAATAANMAEDKANIAAGISELKSTAAYRFKGVQQQIFVQGNHDRIAGTAEGLSTSGAHDTDFYGVYVLNNNDYGWKPDSSSDRISGDPATIQQTAANMEAYFNAKISEGYDKPIFIAAHIPLHSSYRTRAHGENVYAKYIFDVINEAGKSLNIIYLFGHNHSASSDSYIGGGSAYLGRGETIFIPQLGKKDATPTQETLNFTYMNAGYVGYVRNENAGGNELTVSVFEITGNKVEVKRYTRNGITNVRVAGGLYTGAGETAATYGMTTADFNEYMNPSYKTATITAPSVVSDGAINGQWVEIPSYTATAYYQTFRFIEDGVYLIANYGDGTGTWSALQETSAGNVSSTEVTIQKNERGYFITLPDASTANRKEWTFDGFCVNIFATVGSLKNGYTGRYLQADEGGTQGLSLQVVSGSEATTLRTTSVRDTNLTDKKFWVYDSTARTADNGHKGLYSGLAVFVGGTDVAADTRNYVLRKDNENRWAYRGSTGPTGKCGPTYIYAKVTDHYDPANSTYAMATIEDHIDFYLGQFDSQAEMKDFIRSNLLNVSLMNVNGNVSTISNYMLSTTADPNAEGEYTATVSYMGRVLATFEIHISKATVTNMEIAPAEGVVFQNANSTEKTGSVLTITYDNGSVVEVPITVSMLRTSGNNAVSTKNIGTQTNLKVVYGDITIDGYSLRVIDKNYPEYPNPGSVKVDKEGTGVEFDKTGAANVELSATGVPLVNGLDVIVMVDTSSSMSAGNTEDGVRRDIATYNAINQLITTLQGDVENGILGETKIAVADFNAYKKASSGTDYANQPWGYYALDGNCWVRDPENNPNNTGLHYSTNTSHTHGARTGVTDPLNLTEAAFVNVMDLSSTWASEETLPLQSGTNYDFAFDAIYQLGYNIQEYNRKNGRDGRELVVIFLSDGCPFQYNYWMSHANNYNWNDWLSGTLDQSGLNTLTGNVGTFQHFYNSDNGKHWMAEAIKGSPDEYYKVIRKSDTGLEGVIKNLNTTDATNKQYMGELPGLGAQMYSIALGITDGDANITYETIIGVLERIASKPENFYNVNSGEELVNVFGSIAGTVTQAATQSYFLDTMGDDYDLYMSNQIVCSNGTVLEGTVPAIRVLDYPVNDYVTDKTSGTVLEEITFKENYMNVPEGTDMVVYQKLLNADGTYTENTINMKMGELLMGEYVYYNTSKTDSKTVTYNGKTITVEPETFFYITTTLVEGIEYALNYYVYLEDALDDNGDNIAVDAGTYPTNESAKLYYENYLGNSCTKDTVSPELDWGEAKVNYRFYLVNDAGEPIDENGTVISYTVDTFVTEVTTLGNAGSYTFDLNTQLPVIQSGKLTIPEGYVLYEYNGGEGVSYTVKPVSGGGIGGWWKITGDDSATQTTFVQNYRPDKPDRISKALEYTNTSSTGYDFNNTTVWIALVKLPEPGMPVDKKVEATSDPNKFILTLDAYATGDELDGVLLDENLVMKEVLSDYVQLDADATVKYLVYTQDYLGNGQWGDLVSFNGTVETTTKNGRVETVEVSGFDYGANFVMETPRVDPNDSSNTAFRGRRLVLKVYIETREGFWGGNNVPTNKSTTAIYSDGEVFKPFPVPEINVPIDVTVDVVDKTIYYDGSLDSDGDGKEGEELIHQVTIGGMEVEVNEDGTFTPAEDWMDDFAQASWDENSTTPGSDLSNTQPHDYTYTVVVTPNSDGTTNQSPNPGNIAGNVDGGTVDPEDLTAPSQSAADTGHVFVLAPEIIFQDSTTDYGTPTEGYDYEGKDYVDTNWVYMEDDKDTANAPEVSGEEPQLDLSYTASDEDAPDGSFVADTQVEVTVTMNGKEITDIVNFGWQDNCSSGDHTDSMDVPSHMGNETSNEFWVHVLLKILPDTVVVDFGLPVEIHVLVNDKLGDAAELIALGAVPADLDSTHELRTGFLDAYASGLGAAEIKNDAVVYTPSNMQMDAADVFAYAVKHTKGETATYYYGTVTVVPATMIYYEDDFVDFTGTWQTAGEDQGGNQGEDRPGEFEFPEYDEDHIYGYDPAYDNSTTYSLGSARYASVSSKTFETDGAWPTAKFTFTGTGFDLISLTSNQTGFITCRVYKGNQTDTIYESWGVDTYYGYSRTIDQEYPWVEYTWTYNGERWTATKTCVAEKSKEESTELPTKPNTGDVVILYKENYIWTPVDSNTSNDLYQIPVIKSPELDYGIYTVVITPTYIPFFDHTGSGGYDFYLDAVRIYAPAENMEDYYLQDGEAYPQYVELRKQLLTTDEAGNTTGYVNGISFIDGVEEGLLADYDAYGPNNEIYLNPNQAIAFAIDSKGESIANVHVGVKIFDNPGTLTAAALDAKGNTLAEQTITTTSHTDLYYSISNTYIPVEGENISNVIVLTNTGSSPITLTTLKITYGEKPTADSELVMDLEKMQAAAGYVERKVTLDLPMLQELQLSMGHSVNFESDLQMNYRIKRDALEGYDLSTAYLVVEKDIYPAKGEATVETYTLYPDLTTDAERMIFRLTGIQAAEMGSELRATLHIRDTRGREVQSNADTYSILAYAKLCFERYSYEAQPAMYRLLMDSLNYGAAAQLYFGRRTDCLVNAGLEAYQQYATTELAEELNDSKVTTATIQNAPVSKLGFSVSFTDKTELNVKLTLTGSAAEITSVRVTDESGNLLATLSEFTELPDGRLQTTYTGILATQLRQMFYFTAYSGEEAVSATCGYSVEAYARSCIYGSDQGLAQLVRSCMYYGDSALAYFAEKGAESN